MLVEERNHLVEAEGKMLHLGEPKPAIFKPYTSCPCRSG